MRVNPMPVARVAGGSYCSSSTATAHASWNQTPCVCFCWRGILRTLHAAHTQADEAFCARCAGKVIVVDNLAALKQSPAENHWKIMQEAQTNHKDDMEQTPIFFRQAGPQRPVTNKVGRLTCLLMCTRVMCHHVLRGRCCANRATSDIGCQHGGGAMRVRTSPPSHQRGQSLQLGPPSRATSGVRASNWGLQTTSGVRASNWGLRAATWLLHFGTAADAGLIACGVSRLPIARLRPDLHAGHVVSCWFASAHSSLHTRVSGLAGGKPQAFKSEAKVVVAFWIFSFFRAASAARGSSSSCGNCRSNCCSCNSCSSK